LVFEATAVCVASAVCSTLYHKVLRHSYTSCSSTSLWSTAFLLNKILSAHSSSLTLSLICFARISSKWKSKSSHLFMSLDC